MRPTLGIPGPTRFVAAEYSSEWSYKGDTMSLTVASPPLSCDLRLTGAGQVMYSEVVGSRHSSLEPFSKLDVFENPNNIVFEDPSRLINGDRGEIVGVAVN